MVGDESAFDSLGQGVDGRSQPHRFLFSFEDASLEVGEPSGDRGLELPTVAAGATRGSGK
jgi:hypothetical protein